jgi:hypothetical protein
LTRFKPIVQLSELTVATATTALVAMAFTPSELTAIMIASGALVTTIFTGVVNIITALRAERKLDHAIVRVDEVGAKADVISGHVNSAATASTAKIDAMQKQIDQLTRLLADSKQTAAVLAQSRADVAVLAPIAATVEMKPVEP